MMYGEGKINTGLKYFTCTRRVGTAREKIVSIEPIYFYLRRGPTFFRLVHDEDATRNLMIKIKKCFARDNSSVELSNFHYT